MHKLSRAGITLERRDNHRSAWQVRVEREWLSSLSSNTCRAQESAGQWASCRRRPRSLARRLELADLKHCSLGMVRVQPFVWLEVLFQQTSCFFERLPWLVGCLHGSASPCVRLQFLRLRYRCLKYLRYLTRLHLLPPLNWHYALLFFTQQLLLAILYTLFFTLSLSP